MTGSAGLYVQLKEGIFDMHHTYTIGLEKLLGRSLRSFLVQGTLDDAIATNWDITYTETPLDANDPLNPILPLFEGFPDETGGSSEESEQLAEFLHVMEERDLPANIVWSKDIDCVERSITRRFGTTPRLVKVPPEVRSAVDSCFERVHGRNTQDVSIIWEDLSKVEQKAINSFLAQRDDRIDGCDTIIGFDGCGSCMDCDMGLGEEYQNAYYEDPACDECWFCWPCVDEAAS